MKLSVDFGGWTTTKAALAVAGVLAIGGAVGSAIAISPIVTPPIKWQGGWETSRGIEAPGRYEVDVVPAGKSLMVTDIAAGNLGAGVADFHVFVGTAVNCMSVFKYRMRALVIPPNSTLHMPLETGIGFGPGTRICIEVLGGTPVVNFRGFLFTPAPAS